MEKRFGGPGKVLEFFVSKRVGTLFISLCTHWWYL